MTLNSLVAIVKSGFSDITATLNKQQEAIQDLQTQIPHNVASGATSVSKDLHQKLQYHTSNESKNHSDMTDRINQIESATPDPMLIRTVTALNSTMEKLMTVLTRMQQSADTQSKATLHIQEMSFNQVQAPADDSCLTMIKSFHSYRNYKSGGGSMNFYELVKRSPDVLELYLEKARKFQYNFFFNMEDDTIFFHELLDRVFYPDGVTVEAFNQLVSSKKMTEFTFQAASSFKTWIYYLTKTLCDQLPEALIHQLWDRVSRNAFPNSFQYSLLSHPPRNLKDFAKTIEARAAIFRDNGQRSHHDSSHTNSNQSGANDSASTHHRSPPPPPIFHRIHINSRVLTSVVHQQSTKLVSQIVIHFLTLIVILLQSTVTSTVLDVMIQLILIMIRWLVSSQTQTVTTSTSFVPLPSYLFIFQELLFFLHFRKNRDHVEGRELVHSWEYYHFLVPAPTVCAVLGSWYHTSFVQ